MSPDAFKSKYNCNNGTECASLSGLYECSLGKYGNFDTILWPSPPPLNWVIIDDYDPRSPLSLSSTFHTYSKCHRSPGHCRNVSMHYQCQFTADGITIDAERDNMKLNGFFDCKKSRCVKLIRPPTRCDRYCPKITTTAVNVLIMHGDSLVTAECDIGYAHNEARGDEPGVQLTQRQQIWTEHDGILLINCFEVFKENDKIRWVFWGEISFQAIFTVIFFI